MARTRAPRSQSFRASTEPVKPVAPVISTRAPAGMDARVSMEPQVKSPFFRAMARSRRRRACTMRCRASD